MSSQDVSDIEVDAATETENFANQATLSSADILAPKPSESLAYAEDGRGAGKIESATDAAAWRRGPPSAPLFQRNSSLNLNYDDYNQAFLAAEVGMNVTEPNEDKRHRSASFTTDTMSTDATSEPLDLAQARRTTRSVNRAKVTRFKGNYYDMSALLSQEAHQPSSGRYDRKRKRSTGAEVLKFSGYAC